MKERRSQPRVAAFARLWCEAEGVTLFGRLHDVSATGALLVTGVALPPRTRAVVSLPSGATADAEVVEFRSGGGLALRLVSGGERIAAELGAP